MTYEDAVKLKALADELLDTANEKRSLLKHAALLLADHYPERIEALIQQIAKERGRAQGSE